MKILGLDLGQTQDQAAAALLDTEPGWDLLASIAAPSDAFVCRRLKAYPLRTAYADVCEDALASGADVIVPDFCGVGRPVVEIMLGMARARGWRGRVEPVVTVGSAANTIARVRQRRNPLLHEPDTQYSVPKLELVSSFERLRQAGRLVLQEGPEVRHLLAQLADFKLRHSTTVVHLGHSPGKHDDLVIALGLACWYSLAVGNRKLPSIYLGPGDPGDAGAAADQARLRASRGGIDATVPLSLKDEAAWRGEAQGVPLAGPRPATRRMPW